MVSRSDSESSCSPRFVDPLRSQKRIVTSFLTSCTGTAGASGVPQNPHRRNFAGFSSPQFGQSCMSNQSMATARFGKGRPCARIGGARDSTGGALRMTVPIVFLSAFGSRNEWVGICHAVMNKIAPDSQVIDLSHGVPPLDVRAGALLLSDSLPYLRHDAVILAVVDPSVGRARDIAIRTGDGRVLVGPDNGLLAPSWRAAEGVV